MVWNLVIEHPVENKFYQNFGQKYQKKCNVSKRKNVSVTLRQSHIFLILYKKSFEKNPLQIIQLLSFLQQPVAILAT